MNLAPIVLFVYNRPWHAEQTLRALAVNKLADQSELIIYADGPKANASPETLSSIAKTRELIRSVNWCKAITINESPVNKGLANSIIDGVAEVVNKYGKAIVVEDDLVTNQSFVTYMNQSLEKYQDDDAVISIHGYSYPIAKPTATPYFIKGADCWGWATWKRGWDIFEPSAINLLSRLKENNLTREFNFNNSYNYFSLLEKQAAGEIDSWAIRWYASAFLANKLTLYPPVSLVQNIGFDGSGTHGDIGSNNEPIITDPVDVTFTNVVVAENKAVKKQIERYFKRDALFINKVKRKLASYFNNQPKL